MRELTWSFHFTSAWAHWVFLADSIFYARKSFDNFQLCLNFRGDSASPALSVLDTLESAKPEADN